MKTKSALSYFGSDSEVAGQLAAMLDHCNHVTIPFCGGLAILPHLKARGIVANDANELAINFYRHASGSMGVDYQTALFQRCEETLSHPTEMADAETRLGKHWRGSWVQAWAYWAVCWVGRKGKGGTKHIGGMPSVRRTANGGNNATRLAAVADDLKEWAKEFRRCEFECLDFRELLQRVADNPDCGIYCDPPWVELGRDYAHGFTFADHHALVSHLCRFNETTVVLRYGDHKLIRDLYADPRWQIIEAKSRTQSNAVKGEIWITNRKGAQV